MCEEKKEGKGGRKNTQMKIFMFYSVLCGLAEPLRYYFYNRIANTLLVSVLSHFAVHGYHRIAPIAMRAAL